MRASAPPAFKLITRLLVGSFCYSALAQNNNYKNQQIKARACVGVALLFAWIRPRANLLFCQRAAANEFSPARARCTAGRCLPAAARPLRTVIN
jgi:hypothetical protein